MPLFCNAWAVTAVTAMGTFCTFCAVFWAVTTTSSTVVVVCALAIPPAPAAAIKANMAERPNMEEETRRDFREFIYFPFWRRFLASMGSRRFWLNRGITTAEVPASRPQANPIRPDAKLRARRRNSCIGAAVYRRGIPRSVDVRRLRRAVRTSPARRPDAGAIVARIDAEAAPERPAEVS